MDITRFQPLDVCVHHGYWQNALESDCVHKIFVAGATMKSTFRSVEAPDLHSMKDQYDKIEVLHQNLPLCSNHLKHC